MKPKIRRRSPRPAGPSNQARVVAVVLSVAAAVGAPSVASAQDVSVETSAPLGVVRDVYPEWSPDGRSLVFHSNRVGSVNQVYVLELETGDVRQLTHDPLPKWNARWSPDGASIVYSAGGDEHRVIRVMDPWGRNQRDLTTLEYADFHPSWHPDGTGILFDSDRDHTEGVEITNRELYSLALESGEVTRLTEYADWDTFASFSPDGSMIVWRRVVENFDSTRNAEIYLMNRDGSGLRRLTDNPAFDSYPEWSPDSRRLLFSSNRDGDHYEDFNIYWINTDGTGLERLTTTIHEVEQIRARFSPDGSRIVYNRQFPDGRIEIHVMEVPR